jgi:hypothetical protein
MPSNFKTFLTEVKYTDLYPTDFETFRKKYNKLKNTPGLYVHFSNHRSDTLDKSFHDSPDHTDPVGLYCYPLKYVIEHPADIWYGRSAKYLHVVTITDAAKPLYLQHMNDSDMLQIIRHMNLSTSFSAIENDLKQIKRARRLTGSKAMHKAFMTYVQCHLDDDFKCDTTRSGAEQTALFLKAGYTALIDNAKVINNAIINDREPEQIVFLRRDAFKIVEMFNLRADEAEAKFLTHTNVESDPTYMRKLAALAFAAMGDKLVDSAPEGPHTTIEKLFFSAKKRRLYVDLETVVDRDNLKIGQKKHKSNKLSDGTKGRIKLFSEKGRYSATLFSDETAQEVADKLGAQFRHGEGVADPEFQPLDSKEYVAKAKKVADDESEKRRQRERAEFLSKNVQTFERAWPNVLAAANYLGVTGVPKSIVDPEMQSSIVAFYDRMWRDTNNNKRSIGKYVDELVQQVKDVMAGVTEKEGVDMARIEKSYRRMLGVDLPDDLMYKLEEIYVKAYAAVPYMGYHGIYFASQIIDKMKAEAA